MMKRKQKTLNMMEELYMDALRESVIYCVPAGLHAWAVNALRLATTGKEKIRALEALLKVCTAQGNFMEGLSTIDRLISIPDMAEHRSRLLFLAGNMNEGLYDFDAAMGYYCRSLACASRPEDLHIAIVIKLGFCSLYRKEFKQAEAWCRWAIKLDSRSWEALKNLGASLEHQQRIEEAFLAYFRAVVLSRGRAIPVMHFIRLSQRHPEKLPDVSDFRISMYREYLIAL